ncbi:MAG: hypothetical protein JNJ83_16165 [Verrucomicrobiaceae bacterium]|nr:hypothetical protein [Verrucomicrobiaceae bacterium]
MKTLTAALALVLLVSSCATFVQMPVRTRVDSTPSGLSFKIVNSGGVIVREGVTPAIVSLPGKRQYFRGETYTLTVYRQGRQIGSADMSPGLSPWYFGNLLLGGLIGMVVVDPITGAMWKMPKSAHVSEGGPVLSSAAQNDQQLHIVALSDVPEQDRAKLVRL